MRSSRRAPLLSLAALAFVGVALETPHAEACSCEPIYGSSPRDGAVDVPLNARLLLLEWRGDTRLRSATSEVDLAATSLWSNSTFEMVELVPPDGLAADTFYEVVTADEVLFSFTTGSTEDVEPPPAPVFTDLGWYAAVVTDGSTCHGGEISQLDVQLGETAAPLYEVELSGNPTFLLLFPEQLADLRTEYCHMTFRTPADGEPLCVSITAMDLAGNRSPTTTECIYKTICATRDACYGCDLRGCDPPVADRSCAVGGSGSLGSALLLLLALSRVSRSSRSDRGGASRW